MTGSLFSKTKQHFCIRKPRSQSMLARTRLPKTILWVSNLMLIYLALFTGCRLVLGLLFLPEGGAFKDLAPAFALGLRFDLRWISMLLMPMMVASLFPAYSPFYSAQNRKWWTWYLALVTFAVVFFFAADFGCFFYNQTRLNASALNFAEDPGTSALMLWQSYPVFWMVVGLILLVVGLRWVFTQTHNWVAKHTGNVAYHRAPIVVTTLLFALLIYGSVTSQPLRWMNAFGLNDSFRAYVALNPLQNFFTTLQFRRPQSVPQPDAQHLKPVQEWMGLSANADGFRRSYNGTSLPLNKKPNVVLVLCESFSMYKSSLSGNVLNATPQFAQLAKEGVLYERCFTPHFSTARGLFATLTGIPDVQLSKFSSRNPLALDQRSIINDFEGYDKYYFLGGDPDFNNFRGIVQNIDGLKLIAGPGPAEKQASVWGLSDKDLFLKADKILAQQTQPFFAIIQTADNHRPFSTAAADSGFSMKLVSPEVLQRWGFESVEEYNALRHADASIGTFMEQARRSGYFQNTLFVFVGDHGVAGNARALYSEVWTTERLTDEHVPLLFYAPGILAPQVRKEVVSQVDVLPTIAGITGESYTNTTLGRDVYQPFNPNPYAFIIHHDAGRIGMVTDEFYFSKNLNFHKEELHLLKPVAYSASEQDSIKKHLSEVTTAYYESARWLLLNNKK